MTSLETVTATSTLPPVRDKLQINWIRLAPLLYTIGLFVVWEIGVRLSGLPHTILPTPTRIFEATASIETLKLSMGLKGAVTATDVFDAQYLPPAAERMLP